MQTYQTRDMVSMRHLRYNGADLVPGDRFTAISQTDYDYMLSRGRASKADAGPVEAVSNPHPPQAAEPVARRPPGRPSNAQRLADQEASAQSEMKASDFTPHN